MTTYTRPPNDPHDWAAVCRWEDAGRPPHPPAASADAHTPATEETAPMSPTDDPRTMSQAELDDYLDQLTRAGKDDTPEFHRAHQEWERRDT